MRKLFIVLLSKVEANRQFLICSRDKQRNNRTAIMCRVGNGRLNVVSPLTAESPECHWHNGHLTQSRVLSHIYLIIWCESVISRSPPIRTIRPKLIRFRTASAVAAGSTSGKMLISLTLSQLIVASFFLLLLSFFASSVGHGLSIRMVSVRVDAAIKLFLLCWCWPVGPYWQTMVAMAPQNRMPNNGTCYILNVTCLPMCGLNSECVCVCVNVNSYASALESAFEFLCDGKMTRHIVAREMNFLFGYLDGITVHIQIGISAFDQNGSQLVMLEPMALILIEIRKYLMIFDRRD